MTQPLAIDDRDIDEAELDALRRAYEVRRSYLACKRAIDLVIAGAILLTLAVPLGVIAVAVKTTSKGPALYFARRYGRHGRAFTMLKFRSMHVASATAEAAFSLRVEQTGHIPKSAIDPRVTAFGRWMRRTSVDELPQLINVILGDMALVGPRPVVPEMLQANPHLSRARELVRPGLTGLWQLRDRRNDTHVKFMRHHDLEYIAQLSPWLDCRIMWGTAKMLIGQPNGR